MGAREDHQPLREVSKHEPLPQARQQEACGKTAALIMLNDWNTTPLKVTFEDPDKEPYVCDGRDGDEAAEAIEALRPLQLYEGGTLAELAVSLATASCFASIEVILCNPPSGGVKLVQDALASCDGAYTSKVSALSDKQMESARRKNNDFEFLCIPAAIIDHARQVLHDDPRLDSVLIMSFDEPRLEPWHLAQLCDRLRENPAADVITSWIAWARRLPVLLSRRFFEALDDQALCEPREPSKWRPLPAFEVEEVVFGKRRSRPTSRRRFCVMRFGTESLSLLLRRYGLLVAFKALSRKLA